MRCGAAAFALDSRAERLCAACLLSLGAAEPAGAAHPREPLLPHLSIVTLVGEGPRARAYLAEWNLPGGGVAVIKTRRPESPAAPLDRSAVDRLQALDHPHIAAVFEADVDARGRGYTITDYIPGIPITRFCDEHERTTSALVELMLQVIDGLQHASLLGLAHLNLKPTNVLVAPGPPDIASVLDFEAAMPCASRSDPGREPSGEERDLAAIGLLLHEVTARGPAPPSLELQAIVQQAMHPAPSGRYATLAMLASDLTAWLGSGTRSGL